jgi:hypothetical protein
MSTYSPNLRIELIGTGEQANTWGVTTNRNLGTVIEDAIAGAANITMTNVDYTLTVSDGSVDESRQMILLIGGTNSQVRNVICPSVSKVYVVKNNTAGGFGITIKTNAGTGVTIPNGKTAFVYCDGTNVSFVETALVDSTLYNVSVDSLSAPLSVANGGTGATTLTGVRVAIGAASSGINTDITSILGLTTALAVNQGGTGGATPISARSNLEAAKSGANSDITSLSGLTTAISIAQGGTGADNATSARGNLSAAKSGANTDITSLASPTITTPVLDKPLSNGAKVVVSDLGTLTTGTTTINLAAAQVYTATISVANTVTFAFSNAPSASQSQVVILRLSNAGNGTILWPVGTKFANGVAPTFTSGIDMLGIYYDVTTSTYMVFVAGYNMG